MNRTRSYYLAVFAGLYGTAGLALALSVLCAGCGSGAHLHSIQPIAPLPPAVTVIPQPVATIQPVGPPIALASGRSAGSGPTAPGGE